MKKKREKKKERTSEKTGRTSEKKERTSEKDIPGIFFDLFGPSSTVFDLPITFSNLRVFIFWLELCLVDLTVDIVAACPASLVLGSPVSGLQKDRDWTGPRPVRTGNSRDRRRLQLQSSLRSLKILEVSRQRPVLTGFNQSFQ